MNKNQSYLRFLGLIILEIVGATIFGIVLNFLIPSLPLLFVYGIVHGALAVLCFEKILASHLIFLFANTIAMSICISIDGKGGPLINTFYDAFFFALLFSVILLVLSLISAYITKHIVKNNQTNNTTPK